MLFNSCFHICFQQAHRQKEHLALDLQAAARAENLARARDKLDQSAARKAHIRQLYEIDCDKRMQEKMASEQEKRRQTEAAQAEEDRVASEKYRQHCERIRDQKLRQQIRENNQELRELEMKLRAAYVGKALAVQLSEREVARLKEKKAMQDEQRLVEEKRAQEEQEELQKKTEENKRKQALKGVLQNQMIDKHVMKQRLYEEFLKEKKLIDDVIKAVLEEQMEWVNIGHL